MIDSDLSGIEKELVLKYLTDGNVPVTVTPLESEPEESTGKIKPVVSAVFPVAFSSSQITVMNEGIIVLRNPPQNVLAFADKQVRVEFYFNKLGLYFDTAMKRIQTGLALVVPPVISRIQETPIAPPQGFSASLYFSVSDKKTVNITCHPLNGYDLFSKPVWSGIPIGYQKRAKEYLEEFVVQAHAEKNAGNGLQLISVCRYLAEDSGKVHNRQGRADPPSVIYADYERIVFGTVAGNLLLAQNEEYALKMTFPTGTASVPKRDVFTTCLVEKIYSVPDSSRTCSVCRYVAIKEEDQRFLYEKTTRQLFF
jgi:hypothetical protein